MTKEYMENALINNFRVDKRLADGFIDNDNITEQMKESFIQTYNQNILRVQDLENEKRKLEEIVEKDKFQYDVYESIYVIEETSEQINKEQALLYHSFTHGGELSAPICERDNKLLKIEATPKNDGGWGIKTILSENQNKEDIFNDITLKQNNIASAEDLLSNILVNATNDAKLAFNLDNTNIIKLNITEEDLWRNSVPLTNIPRSHKDSEILINAKNLEKDFEFKQLTVNNMDMINKSEILERAQNIQNEEKIVINDSSVDVHDVIHEGLRGEEMNTKINSETQRDIGGADSEQVLVGGYQMMLADESANEVGDVKGRKAEREREKLEAAIQSGNFEQYIVEDSFEKNRDTQEISEEEIMQ